ncbi:hypothetical protein [Scandinavium goeteborgense]|uniref:Uncharacterized protein n=1 Tax=Scandinavium goeteborgense TaxID=1851514 RepID=A0A4R6DSL3_SCAGO|nr:hypothetical protein [Scandinavium goeteborgense]TDN48076.1 hypothetical protein EC847_12827 [Scandinavium goeteborgense]
MDVELKGYLTVAVIVAILYASLSAILSLSLTDSYALAGQCFGRGLLVGALLTLCFYFHREWHSDSFVPYGYAITAVLAFCMWWPVIRFNDLPDFFTDIDKYLAWYQSYTFLSVVTAIIFLVVLFVFKYKLSRD